MEYNERERLENEIKELYTKIALLNSQKGQGNDENIEKEVASLTALLQKRSVSLELSKIYEERETASKTK